MPFHLFQSKIHALTLRPALWGAFGWGQQGLRGLARRVLAVWMAGVALTGTGLALAEKADRNKPMNIEADALRYDDLKQISVFTGKVVLTKGTIIIKGGQLDVRQDPQGYQYGTVIAEPGKVAFFRQKRDGVDEFIEGEGEIIEYDGKADTVKFVKRAVLRRFKGAVLNDEMSGAVILYDNTVDVFTIDGGAVKDAPGVAGASGTPGASGGRVRAMLIPKPDTTTPVSPPAALPGAGPALQTAPGIGTVKK